MFYRPEDGHGLRRNPFNALIAPRPIGWISTRDNDGHDNLAPYSFFNAAAYTPPQVMFATTGDKPDRELGKDSLDNIRQTGVFCVNLVSEALVEAMNISSGPWIRDIDEFALAKLERSECQTIPCPRVSASPAALECRLVQIVPLEGKVNTLVIGRVTGVHIADSALIEGRFDAAKAGIVARMGYRDYTTIGRVFEVIRPGED